MEWGKLCRTRHRGFQQDLQHSVSLQQEWLSIQPYEFAGFLIADEGIKLGAKYTEAIIEVRAWYGVINQVTYCFCKTAVMAPLKLLSSPPKGCFRTACRGLGALTMTSL